MFRWRNSIDQKKREKEDNTVINKLQTCPPTRPSGSEWSHSPLICLQNRPKQARHIDSRPVLGIFCGLRRGECATKNVKKVVEKCIDLPLTLEVIGCYLRDHKTNAMVWKETLHKLVKALAC